MDNYYPQTQSYGRKPDPPRYDLCFVKGRKGALKISNLEVQLGVES